MYRCFLHTYDLPEQVGTGACIRRLRTGWHTDRHALGEGVVAAVADTIIINEDGCRAGEAAVAFGCRTAGHDETLEGINALAPHDARSVWTGEYRESSCRW